MAEGKLTGRTPVWHIQHPGLKPACAHAHMRMHMQGREVAITSINGVYAIIVKTENLKNHLRNLEKESKRKDDPGSSRRNSRSAGLG